MRYSARPSIEDYRMLKAWFNPSHIAAGFIAVLALAVWAAAGIMAAKAATASRCRMNVFMEPSFLEIVEVYYHKVVRSSLHKTVFAT